nr:hypothetical protein [Tanacetum cinerariifolium]
RLAQHHYLPLHHPHHSDDDEGNDGGDDGKEGDDDDDDDVQDDDDARDDDDQEDEGNDEDDEEEGSDAGQASNEEEFIHPSLSTHAEEETMDEESFDPIPKTSENNDDEGNGVENIGTNVDSNLRAPLPMSAPTLTPSTIATITTTLQAPTPPTTTQSTLLQDLPNFSSLFGFDNRLKTLEANFSEFMQTNQFARATSYVVAADLFEMELKKILIEKMEGNKSIHRSNEQRNLYKALVEAYESDKIILDTYRDTVTLKRRHDSKRRREGKEPESTSAPTEKATRSTNKSTQGSKSRQTSASESATAEEPMQTTFEMEEPSHLEFETGVDDQPIVQSSQHPEWFSQQNKPPTTDHDWNKTLPATHGSIQPWISELTKQSESRSSFNELMDTPVDFSNFLINRLKVDTLTLELLAGHTYELMKGSCKSLVELEFFLKKSTRLQQIN